MFIFILNGFPCPLYRTLQLCQPPPEGEQHEMSVIFIEGCLWKWSYESESAPLPHSDMLYVIFLSMASCLPAIRDLCLMLLSRLIPPIKIFFSAVILCAPRCPSYHLIWTWNYLHYYNQRTNEWLVSTNVIPPVISGIPGSSLLHFFPNQRQMAASSDERRCSLKADSVVLFFLTILPCSLLTWCISPDEVSFYEPHGHRIKNSWEWCFIHSGSVCTVFHISHHMHFWDQE